MISEMKEKCVIKAEYVYVNEIKKTHEDFFLKLRQCFSERTSSNVFIKHVIGDYLYDINQKYEIEEESFILDANNNWGGDFKDYCDELLESINDAKKIVINTYLLYVRHMQDIRSIPLEEINDVSTEYYTLDSYEPYKQVSGDEIANLPKEEKAELIRIIDRVDEMMVNNGRKETKMAIDLVNKALASI